MLNIKLFNGMRLGEIISNQDISYKTDMKLTLCKNVSFFYIYIKLREKEKKKIKYQPKRGKKMAPRIFNVFVLKNIFRSQDIFPLL